MGGMSALLDKLPAQLQANAAAAAGAVDAKTLKRQMGIIDSMTPRERRRPDMIDGSRKRRIAAGAGVPLPEVNRLLKQFDQMQKTMKKMIKGGMLKNMMRGMAGRMPPGFGQPLERICCSAVSRGPASGAVAGRVPNVCSLDQ